MSKNKKETQELDGEKLEEASGGYFRDNSSGSTAKVYDIYDDKTNEVRFSKVPGLTAARSKDQEINGKITYRR